MKGYLGFPAGGACPNCRSCFRGKNAFRDPGDLADQQKLAAVDGYAKAFQAAFAAGPSPDTIAKALASFLRNLRSGAIIDYRFRAEEFLERAILDEAEFEYLYADGDEFHFMNTQTFEQIHLKTDVLGDAMNFLVPTTLLKVEFFENKPIGVDLPDTVDLKVVETEPTMQKATASAVMKPAKLETGLTIQVPPFINAGDTVRVDTTEARYVQRA